MDPPGGDERILWQRPPPVGRPPPNLPPPHRARWSFGTAGSFCVGVGWPSGAAVIACVQRVSRAEVRTDVPPRTVGIGAGLCVLLGVEVGDTDVQADWIADRLPRLRIFPDDEGRMNRDLSAVDGGILLISQFTLAGDCRKGTRPSFVRAAPPDEGRRLYERVAEAMRTAGTPVETGVFGAHMHVDLVNDGPVTLILERRPEGRMDA